MSCLVSSTCKYPQYHRIISITVLSTRTALDSRLPPKSQLSQGIVQTLIHPVQGFRRILCSTWEAQKWHIVSLL